jgi:hypothetical protein
MIVHLDADAFFASVEQAAEVGCEEYFLLTRGTAADSLVCYCLGISDVCPRAAGEQIDDADLSRVSPMAHRHVIPNGTYFHNQAVGNAQAGETK